MSECVCVCVCVCIGVSRGVCRWVGGCDRLTVNSVDRASPHNQQILNIA